MVFEWRKADMRPDLMGHQGRLAGQHPRRAAMAVAATGSARGPSPKQTPPPHVRPVAACAATATLTTITSTRPMAKNPTGLMFSEVPRRKEKGRRIEDRREEDQQDQIWWQLEGRHDGDEA